MLQKPPAPWMPFKQASPGPGKCWQSPPMQRAVALQAVPTGQASPSSTWAAHTLLWLSQYSPSSALHVTISSGRPPELLLPM
jgi:hypothetical protein